jgi:AraC-like DNA-binding protein
MFAVFDRSRNRSAALPNVTLCIHDLDALARVQGCLTPQVQGDLCPTPCTLLSKPLGSAVAAVLLELQDSLGRSSAPRIAALRARHPELPIIGLAGVQSGDLREAVPASRAGLTDLVYLQRENPWDVIRPVLLEPGLGRAITEVLRELADVFGTSEIWPVLEHCINRWSGTVSVAQLARALGVTRKTVSRRFCRAGLGPPASALVWMRLLIAARLLQEPAFPVRRIAEELRYPSAVALRRTMKRHTRQRPGEVRARGGLSAVLPLFLADRVVAPAA